MAQRHFEGLTYWGTRTGMRLAIWAVKIIPRRVLYFIADNVALVAFYLFRAFRTRSVGNLHAALGNDSLGNQSRQIAQNSLKNFFRVFAEVAISLAADTEALGNMVSVAGCEHLNAALAKRNGVILLSAHLGNFFLLGTRLAMSGYPIHVLVNQPRHGRFAELMDQYRLQVLQRTIHARPRREALKQVAKVLRRNEIVIIIADEFRRTGSGIPVPFFGGPVLARRGPATLALRTGAAVIPAYVIRGHDNKLKLTIEPEIELIRSERDKSQIRENILRLTEWLERTVRRYPDQWNWMNIKWDNVPNGALVSKKHGVEQLTH
ncbi:MAG: lysophospholipid acyltransferase family protein [Alphaproteobacteria bacterium]